MDSPPDAQTEPACQRPTPIAIDGPAASGKTTIGEALAAALGYTFLDTGLMYRAFTLAALRQRIPHVDAPACAALAASIPLVVVADGTTRILLGGEDVTGLLRGPEVEANVSLYSAIPAVREAMVRMQREVAAHGDAILAGRDIGTVVLPDAPLKFFIDASEAVRAGRRRTQATAWGNAQAAARVQQEIAGRDRTDRTRAASPLTAAPGAILIDTTELTLAEAIAAVMEHVQCGGG